MRITIDPVTRLEGHAKIEIFLDDAGEVENAYFQVPELRGFERFCQGRPAEEMPLITPRICGVCPGAHHMASAKTCDAVFGVEPPPAGKKLRELFYCAHFIHSHMAHFFALAAPDFLPGPDADPAERNILGLVAKVGPEIGGEVIKHRAYAQKIQAMLGGKATHPACGVPGGMSKPITEEERSQIEDMARSCVEFARQALRIFDQVVLGNPAYVDMIRSDPYTMQTYYMGLVDEAGRVNFYDGKVRVVDPEGREFSTFAPAQYLDHIAERVEPWSYLKFPYLKKVGWKGYVDGRDNGLYRVAPLARLNAAQGMATPLAQAEYERFYDVLGGKPVHHTLANHWARLIEVLYAAERLLELATDPEITSPQVRAIPDRVVGEGVGVVEAPRGTLFHHYRTDERGCITGVNLIVGTVNNHAAICMSVKKAAQGVIHGGKVDQGILNRVEMAFRAYDPCFGCATHSLPGQMPMEVTIRDRSGEVLEVLRR
jgi:F420-non-reducing hydrogenase large subunit